MSVSLHWHYLPPLAPRPPRRLPGNSGPLASEELPACSHNPAQMFYGDSCQHLCSSLHIINKPELVQMKLEESRVASVCVTTDTRHLHVSAAHYCTSLCCSRRLMASSRSLRYCSSNSCSLETRRAEDISFDARLYQC